MKAFKPIFRAFVLVICMLFGLPDVVYSSSVGQADGVRADYSDMRVSLLTCTPRDGVYTMFGHTAIRICMPQGPDLAVNYGMFSFDKPYFVLRFVFGKTDYEMGIIDFETFVNAYQSEGAAVLEQELALTAAEKERLYEALMVNYRPENRVYRYNFLYNNCTTKARDIILGQIKPPVRFQKEISGATYRSMIHYYNRHAPWTRFGEDLLLGVAADQPIGLGQWSCLPEHLSQGFAQAQIADGRKLVVASRWYRPFVAGQDSGDVAVAAWSWLYGPRMVLLVVALVVVLLTVSDVVRRRVSWWADLLLMGLCGLIGWILTAMIFSEHPTVSLNLQILLFNPFCHLALWPVISGLRHGYVSRWLMAWLCCLFLMVNGALWQDYADGVLMLAQSLLFRYLVLSWSMKKARLSMTATTSSSTI